MSAPTLAAASFFSLSLATILAAQQPSPPPSPPPPTPPTPATPAPSLTVGAPAPPLAVETFLKGEPITAFKPGAVYVLEFWATWCGPCVAAMPHLSELQAQFKDKGVTFLGVNVWEDKAYDEGTLKTVREFVQKKGDAMAYTVAYDGSARAMDTRWMKAAGRNGIPTTFVVDKSGSIAWIGHPSDLDPVVDEVVRGVWDIAEGPKKLKAARDAAFAACKKYSEGFQAGEDAWSAATKDRAYLASKFAGLRYSEMVAGGHYDRAYAFGREMFNAAKARKDSAALMGAVMPMLDPEIKPKTIDRKLAQDVADAVLELGDPSDPGRHICAFQIQLLLGNADQASMHRAKAIELIPKENQDSLVRWLDELEAAAEKK